MEKIEFYLFLVISVYICFILFTESVKIFTFQMKCMTNHKENFNDFSFVSSKHTKFVSIFRIKDTNFL